MERAERLLGGKSLFKSQNDGTIDKTKVVCSICQAEFSYHRSSSSLSYHLNQPTVLNYVDGPTVTGNLNCVSVGNLFTDWSSYFSEVVECGLATI